MTGIEGIPINLEFAIPAGIAIVLIYALVTSKKIKLSLPGTFSMGGSGKKGGGLGKCESGVKAIIVDDRSRRLDMVCLQHIVGNVYATVGRKDVAFHIETPGTYYYIDDSGDKVFLARRHDILLMPIDPSLEEVLSVAMAEDKESLVHMDYARAVELVTKLFEKKSTQSKEIRVPGVGALTLSFNPSDVTAQLLHHTVRGGIEALKHVFNAAKVADAFAKTLEAKARYEETVQKRFTTIAYAIAMVLVMIIIMLVVLSGG